MSGAGEEERAGGPGGLPDRVDALVVGGGIAGVSVAYHLACRGVEVLLVEREAIGSGTTNAAVGVLSPPLRQPYHETVRFRGEDEARAIWSFALRSTAGLARVLEERGDAERAELDLAGGFVLAESYTEHQLRNSFDALESAGFPVEWISREAIAEETGGRGFTGGYRIEGGGSLSPGPTTRAMARAATEAGARIREATELERVERTERGLVAHLEGGARLRAGVVVYATHISSGRFSEFLGHEIVPIRGQGLETMPVDAEFEGAYATHWKMNMWRQTRDGGLRLSGWRHDAWDRSYYRGRPEVDERLQRDIQAWFETAFPALAPLRVRERWSGVFGWTADYLPLVGPRPGRPGEFVNSGFSGGGLPFAFGCGDVVAAAVAGDELPPGSELFNPRRFG